VICSRIWCQRATGSRYCLYPYQARRQPTCGELCRKAISRGNCHSRQRKASRAHQRRCRIQGRHDNACAGHRYRSARSRTSRSFPHVVTSTASRCLSDSRVIGSAHRACRQSRQKPCFSVSSKGKRLLADHRKLLGRRHRRQVISGIRGTAAAPVSSEPPRARNPSAPARGRGNASERKSQRRSRSRSRPQTVTPTPIGGNRVALPAGTHCRSRKP